MWSKYWPLGAAAPASAAPARPPSPPPPADPAAPSEARGLSEAETRHTVTPRCTLMSLSLRYGVPERLIQLANDLPSLHARNSS